MNMPQAEGATATLWKAMSGDATRFPQLDADRKADVVIIGGGYTGLAAAHSVARRGLQPLVVEANTIGWGASGRNGGVVSAKYRIAYSQMAREHGIQVAKAMYRLSHEAVAFVQELILDYGLVEAELTLNGGIRCAHNGRAYAALKEELAWMRQELGEDAGRLLDAHEVAIETGSRSFVGGVISPGVGTLLPYQFVCGLAREINKRYPDTLFERTPALRVEQRNHKICVYTPYGKIQADQLILATNAYSGISPVSQKIKRRVIPFRSSIIATEPLAESLQQRLLVNDRHYGETRRMMRWFRKADRRFVFGGRGAFGKHDSAAAFNALQRAMVEMFPELADTRIDYRWSGHVAMTLDALPHVGRLNERVSFAAGYNGAGVAMSTLMGQLAADFALGSNPDVALLEGGRFRPVPLYPLREAGIRVVAGWYQFLDAIGR
ncbi:NAD(P)/FAD-dependent oxidoreductase [Vreelandella olivaria]|uniref:NAD(P)/FAD-dependent oxidoreductase n=1 Tax=Vreelandella olivaria TaxID=390919 RepID=UPI00201F3FD1|nr:FAD-binding oxidoreductase [Halomonas olivaria]